MKISAKKYSRLEKLSNDKGVVAALAIDQRGAMERMVPNLEEEERTTTIKNYKKAVAKELTPFSSAILLDARYGLDAIKTKDENAGLLLAYEVTGYRDDNRQLELMPTLSARRLIELGADAAKILLYYNVDDTDETNEVKKAAIERIGSECEAEGLPFFLEIITYDNEVKDSKSKEFAKLKPRKVIDAVKEFTKPQYRVDVLKLEVPVNMDYVETFGEDYVYTREEALKYFKEQSDVTNLPILYLSAGVSAELFQETLKFAKEAGTEFHGVLCGRATWKGGVPEFLESEDKGLQWLKSQGKENIEDLNKVINETCVSWKERLEK